MIDLSTLTFTELSDLSAKISKELVKRDKENRTRLMNNIKEAVFEYVKHYGNITINTEDGNYYLDVTAVFDGVNDEITIE